MKDYMVVIAGSAIDTFYNVETFLQGGDSCMAIPQGDRVGGCVLNTAAVAAGYGMDVKVLDYLQRDNAGTHLILSTMQQCNIDTSYIQLDANITNGRCLIMQSGKEKCIYVIDPVHPLYNMSDGKLQNLLNNAKVIYTLMHIARAAFGNDCQPLKIAKQHGAKIAFDGASQYQNPMDVENIKLADYLFINIQAYRRLCDAMGQNASQVLFSHGASAICVTDGENGADCILRDQVLHTPALKIEQVIDSTGAGDTFAGTFLSSLMGGYSHIESLKRAAAAGARACLYAGGFGGVCNNQDLCDFAAANHFYLNETNT